MNLENVEKYLKIEKKVNRIVYLSKMIREKKKDTLLDRLGDTSRLSIKLDNSLNTSSFKFSFNHIYNDIASNGVLSVEYSLLLQHELRLESLKGNVKPLFEKFSNLLSSKYKINKNMISQLIDQASLSNVVHLQTKQFTLSKYLKFVSLKVPLYFSHENFLWVINSLIFDKVNKHK